MDHQKVDCDEMVHFKKEGRKIHREYRNWMKAEGPEAVISKGFAFDQGSKGKAIPNSIHETQGKR